MRSTELQYGNAWHRFHFETAKIGPGECDIYFNEVVHMYYGIRRLHLNFLPFSIFLKEKCLLIKYQRNHNNRLESLKIILTHNSNNLQEKQ